MDPLTILAGLKTGLAAGKTVAGLSKQIGQFFVDLNFTFGLLT